MLRNNSYANCLLASLNFRLVLRDQSDPNLTTIIWDDLPSNMRSSQPGSQPTQLQIPAQAEASVDLNKVRSFIPTWSFIDLCRFELRVDRPEKEWFYRGSDMQGSSIRSLRSA